MYEVRVCEGELVEVGRASCYDESVYQTTFTGSEETKVHIIYRDRKKKPSRQINTYPNYATLNCLICKSDKQVTRSLSQKKEGNIVQDLVNYYTTFTEHISLLYQFVIYA